MSAPLIVLTGPSGVGKGTLEHWLRQRFPQLQQTISATTRSPRAGEEHGRDYWFMNAQEFAQAVAQDRFVEHATYNGHLYGTLRQELERCQSRGPTLLELEVQGARQLRAVQIPALFVFVAPPSLDDLRRRLEGRGTESAEQIRRRLLIAEQELECQAVFDRVLVNDSLETACQQLEQIVAPLLQQAGVHS